MKLWVLEAMIARKLMFLQCNNEVVLDRKIALRFDTKHAALGFLKKCPMLFDIFKPAEYEFEEQDES